MLCLIYVFNFKFHKAGRIGVIFFITNLYKGGGIVKKTHKVIRGGSVRKKTGCPSRWKLRKEHKEIKYAKR
ncbi:MAG TPA: hypothetical protein DDY52_04035 [Candidatus Moranbacteria bacterium]|nr:hypothetical protein [Candidatus Moranbacteria bacterium]